MIYVLFGEDTDTAYKRLSALRAENSTLQKVNLTKDSSKEAVYGELFGQDLLGQNKLIICENLISTLKTEELKNIQKEQVVIFWENKKLTPAQVKKLAHFAKFEEFKPKTYLFLFLDSIIPGSKAALVYLAKLDSNEAIIWNLTNRLLCLTLAKQGLSVQQASLAIGRQLAPWQWQKVIEQAQGFPKETLFLMYKGLLKIDYLIKSGTTALGAKDLIGILLFKYLKV